MSDAVNPKHYKGHPSGVECIDIAEWLGFNLGNAFKYVWRAGLKGSDTREQDLLKALWYVRREMATGAKMPVHADPEIENALDEKVDRVLAADPSRNGAVLAALYQSARFNTPLSIAESSILSLKLTAPQETVRQ